MLDIASELVESFITDVPDGQVALDLDYGVAGLDVDATALTRRRLEVNRLNTVLSEIERRC
ncbi:MAG: hypothetical protein M3198_14830 [Actinomycetota bacterium]|nr:hypothetical protein [Actinomycetota bacterium]